MNRTKMNKLKLLGLIFVLILTACEEDKKSKPKTQVVVPQIRLREAPVFSEDTAFYYIEKQLSFGPRVPNSKAQQKCAEWLEQELKKRGAETMIQQTKARRFDGEVLKIMNIIGAFRPERERRVLLSAHWDSRFIADAGEINKDKAVPAANDGASGVAVLLEIARLISLQQPEVGIDIIFWDAEDQGNNQSNESWCLGSQYWARNPHVKGYKAIYAINLDMVGGVNTWFPQEQTSIQYAKPIVDRIWNTAHAIGYGEHFPYMQQDPVTDDHYYINRIAGIPAVDIIARDLGGKGFYEHWHTHEDDISNISKPILKAVGQTVTQVIYDEQ